jgi:hypothetical protein
MPRLGSMLETTSRHSVTFTVSILGEHCFCLSHFFTFWCSTVKYPIDSGRLEVELFPTLLRLRGKTHDYQLKYDAITHLFLLEKSDEVNMLFAVSGSDLFFVSS